MASTWSVPIAAATTIENSRTPINNALEALRTLHSGASAPASTVAGMLWKDTTAKLIKMRNDADDGWITMFDLQHEDGSSTATSYGGLQRAVWKTVGNSGAAKTIDWSDASCQHVMLSDNCTLTFSNPRYGEIMTLFVEQDGTGSRTCQFAASTVRAADGEVWTVTATADKTDVLMFVYSALDSRYDVISVKQNLAAIAYA